MQQRFKYLVHFLLSSKLILAKDQSEYLDKEGAWQEASNSRGKISELVKAKSDNSQQALVQEQKDNLQQALVKKQEDKSQQALVEEKIDNLQLVAAKAGFEGSNNQPSFVGLDYNSEDRTWQRDPKAKKPQKKTKKKRKSMGKNGRRKNRYGRRMDGQNQRGLKQNGRGKVKSRGRKRNRNRRGIGNANRKENKNRNLTKKKGNWGSGNKRNWKGKKRLNGKGNKNPSRKGGKTLSTFINNIQKETELMRYFILNTLITIVIDLTRNPLFEISLIPTPVCLDRSFESQQNHPCNSR